MTGNLASAVLSAAYEAGAATVKVGDRLLVVGGFAVFVTSNDVLARQGGRWVTVKSVAVKSSGLVELVAGVSGSTGELFLVHSGDTVVVERGSL